MGDGRLRHGLCHRAIFFDRQTYGFLSFVVVNVAVKLEMKVCLHKRSRYRILFTFTRHRDLNVSKGLSLLAEDIDHVYGTTSTQRRQEQLHWSHAEVLSPNIR